MKRKHRENKSPTKPPPSKGAAGQIERLSQAFESLSKASNENAEAFSKALCYADAMLFVLCTAMNDQLNGTLHTVEPAPGVRHLDLAFYVKLYEDLEAKRGVENSSPTHQSALELTDETVVFGGP